MRVIRVGGQVLLAATGVAGAVVAAALGSPGLDDVLIVVVVAAYAAVAVAVGLARPGHLVARVMLLGATTWGVGEALIAVGSSVLDDRPDAAGAAAAAVLGTAARGFGWLVLVLVLPLVFPEGRVPRGRAAVLTWVCLASFTAATLLAPVPLENSLSEVDNPLGLPADLAPVADLLAIGSLLLAFAALAATVVTLVRRWRAGGELLRQQVLEFGVAFAVPLLLLPLVPTPWAAPWMFAVASLPVPVAVAVAMFQRRLYDVQLAVTRTLTYLALSATLAALYALVVGGVGVLLRDHSTPWLPWAAAGAVAVAFAPLRDWLQGAVTRMTYGRWSAPADVLAETGRRLADAADGAALLGALTDELVHGLGLTYAEIRDASGRSLASAGTPTPGGERLPLSAYGRPVGHLLVAGPTLRPADRLLLADLAHQIGGAVHTVALVEELRAAQERLVLAREQERRRLRSDLHDGLGPSLAGLGFQLDAVQNLIADGRPVDDQLTGLRAGLRETVTEVRRIVEGLRPPAVDELGLFGAVAELGQALAEGSGLELALDLPDQRPALPAAVEVTAYRVAQEALTNVVRHSGARSCHVAGRVSEDALVLEVADDGCGGAGARAGLGIPGMHDRAREIGGRVEVAAGNPGTLVRLRLPLATGGDA